MAKLTKTEKLMQSKRYAAALKKIDAGKPAPKWLRDYAAARLIAITAHTAKRAQEGALDKGMHAAFIMFASAERQQIV
jgi:hypothetical protein